MAVELDTNIIRNYPLLLIGLRIESLFPNKKWYKGRIEDYNENTKKYIIEYEDGDIIEKDLKKTIFRVVEGGELLVKIINNIYSNISTHRGNLHPFLYFPNGKERVVNGQEKIVNDLIKNDPDVLVGIKIAVQLKNKLYYKGIISRYNEELESFHIDYDDGHTWDGELTSLLFIIPDSYTVQLLDNLYTRYKDGDELESVNNSLYFYDPSGHELPIDKDILNKFPHLLVGIEVAIPNEHGQWSKGIIINYNKLNKMFQIEQINLDHDSASALSENSRLYYDLSKNPFIIINNAIVSLLNRQVRLEKELKGCRIIAKSLSNKKYKH